MTRSSTTQSRSRSVTPRHAGKPRSSTASMQLSFRYPFSKTGELVYKLPTLEEIKRTCAYGVSTLWPEVKRFDYPHQYYVDLSAKLMALKDEMLKQGRR